MKFILHCSLLAASLSASFAAAQGSMDDPQARATSIILRSCQPCHKTSTSPRFITTAGDVDWISVKSHASGIISEVKRSAMPPQGSPQAQQMTSDDRKILTDYVQSLTPSLPGNGGLPLANLKLPTGFAIELFAKAEGARSLAVSPDGIVFVGTGGFSNVDPKGRVHAIVPTPTGRKVMALAWNLDNPNGIALRGNDLYVAEQARVIKFANVIEYVKTHINQPSSQISAPYTVVSSDLPEQSNHSWKYLGFGPDDKLYINIGAPCNICMPDRNTFASIYRLNQDGSNFERVARGVRNTVGFAWHPETNDLWFTDNGRDQLGDDIPPDELNHLTQIDEDFGFPFCHGKNIRDPEFGQNQDCDGSYFTKPEVELGAHVAALGMAFYQGSMFPNTYKNAIFIAEHGSWNRNAKSGYRLSLVQFTLNGEGKSVASYQPFISGWLNDASQTNWGRPVDVKNYTDGSLLLSDDQAGAVYRVFYRGH